MNHQKETINNNNFFLEFSLLKQRRKEKSFSFVLPMSVCMARDRSRRNVCQVATDIAR